MLVAGDRVTDVSLTFISLFDASIVFLQLRVICDAMIYSYCCCRCTVVDDFICFLLVRSQIVVCSADIAILLSLLFCGKAGLSWHGDEICTTDTGQSASPDRAKAIVSSVYISTDTFSYVC